MTTVSCPKCRDQVSVPASAPRGARVRCPLCQEEYDLADALAQLPPALIIVSTGVAEELAAVGSMDTASGSHIGSELDRGFDSHLEGGSGKGYSSSVLDSEPTHTGMVSAPTPSFRAAPRPKRKEKSMVGELVKIVLGGVVGIGLAILILWWVAGVDLGIAPTIAKVSWMRWVLPQKILDKVDKNQGNPEVNPDELQPINTDPGEGNGKPKKKPAEEASTNGTRKPKATTSAKTEEPASGEGALKIESPIGTDKKAPVKSPEKTKAATSDEPTGDDPFKLPENPMRKTKTVTPKEPAEVKPAEEKPAEPKEEKPTTDEPKEETTKKKEVPKEEPAKEEPKEEKPAEKPEEKPAEKPAESTEPKEAAAPASLAEGIEAANTASKAFDETDAADKEARKTAIDSLYKAYAGLGRTVEQANLEDADNAEKLPALRQALAQAASDPLRLNSIGFFAAKKLDSAEGDPGILVAGTVKDLKAAGGHFETTLELVRDKRIVTIVSSKNPQDSYKVDDQVLILGSIVRDPKEKLAGYKGEAEVVVKSGHAMVLPPKP